MDAALYGALVKVIEHYEGGADLEANKATTIDVSQYSGAVEITPTSGNDAMKKATVTLSNIPVIESNKAQTIDVSEYTEAVEITPTSGKDGMAKATVTLSNIPAGGVSTLYCWYDSEDDKTIYTLSATPSVGDMVLIGGGESGLGGSPIDSDYNVESFDGNILTIDNIGVGTSYTRYQAGDISLT